jgi:GNAT superfamily N-acetyltransferase/DNA-binding MarR family transcriptional regulator
MQSYNQLGHVTLGTTLRQLADLVSKDAESIYTVFDFQINPKWFPVFYVLATKESGSVVNIATEIQQSHVSVSKIIKEMKSGGLINSYKSHDDSRVTLIKLNDRAKAMIPAMERQCEAVNTAMNKLTKESGINLWEALTVTHQHLKNYKLSERIQNINQEYAINIVDYSSIHQAEFKALNVDWISQYWELEAPDHFALDEPETYILNNDGIILIALNNQTPIGCCALIKKDEHTYELAKMAVSPQARGKKIGLLLGRKIIERAKLMGIKRLYLESNSVLKPAVNLYLKLGFTHIENSSSPYNRCNVQMELLLEV